MELSLINNDPSNTLLVTQDAIPTYSIQTRTVLHKSANLKITTIKRLERGKAAEDVSSSLQVGSIEYHEVEGTKLSLFSDNMHLALKPRDVGLAENSWAFTGPDNRSYKWQIFIKYPILFLNDNTHTPIARYRRAKLGIVSRSRRAFLEILPAGINCIDMIVITFVSFMKQSFTSLNVNHEKET